MSRQLVRSPIKPHWFRGAFGGDVIGSYGRKGLPMMCFPFILGGITAAASHDPRLLSLVPPGAQLVAGIGAPSIQGQPDNFVLMTHYNSVDMEDFFALTGADDERTIHQIVFVSATSTVGQLNEHSLLVSGHFDQLHVFKSASQGGAAVTDYRSVPILVIQPLARERGTLHDVRWLAILDSRVLVFGTISSTRLELDRYLEHSRTDDALLRRLAHLRSKDQTWCVLSAPVKNLSLPTWRHEIYAVLAKLNAELADLAQSGNDLEFGLYYGRRVEFEYELTSASTAVRRVRPDSLRQSPVEPAKSASLLSALGTPGDANTRHGVIVVSMSRYNTWLAEIRGRRIPVD